MNHTENGPKIPLNLRLALALEDWVNRHTYEPGQAPRGRTISRRAVVIGSGAVGTLATLGSLEVFRQGQRPQKVVLGTPFVKSARSPVHQLNPETTFRKDEQIIGQGQIYNRGEVYIFNEVPGLRIKINDTRMAELLSDSRLGIKTPSVFTSVLTVYSKNLTTAQEALISNRVLPVLIATGKYKDSLYYNIDIPQVAYDSAHNFPNKTEALRAVGKELSLVWARGARKLAVETGATDRSAELNQEDTAKVENIIEVIDIDPRFIYQPRNFEAPTVKLGDAEILLNPDSIVIYNGLVIINETPGLNIAFSTGLYEALNQIENINLRPDEMHALVFLPISSDMAEYERQVREFMQTKLPEISKKNALENTDLNLRLTFVPVKQLVKNAFNQRMPGESAQSRYHFMAIEFAGIYAKGRRKALGIAETGVQQPLYPFSVVSVDPQLIEQSLR